MAINRLWQAGAELNNTIEFDSIVGSFAASATQKKTGSYSFAAVDDNRYGIKSIPATRQIRMGFFLYGGSNNPPSLQPILKFRTSGGTVLAQFETINPGLGGAYVIDIAGVDKDTEPGMNLATWQHIGIDLKIDSSAGWMKLYVDGVEKLSFTGNTGNADILDFAVGNGAASGSGVIFYFDDLYVDDTTGEGAAAAPPILRFYYTTPNADGNYSQWDGSDGNQVNNYLLVDEIPPNSDTDYVETNVVDEFDSYNMTTITLEAGQQVEAVIPIVFMKRAGSTEEIALGTRLSGTDAVGSDQAPGTSYDTLWERQTTKPGGGAWGQSDINSFEALVKSRGSY